MSYIKLTLIPIFTIAIIANVAFPASAQLSSEIKDEMRSQVTQFNGPAGGGAGFDNTVNMATIVQKVITAFLSLLGIIFIVLVLLGGYYWMTASGDEAKVTKAKDTIMRAVIGLIIVVCAYSITYFVFSHLGTAGPG